MHICFRVIEEKEEDEFSPNEEENEKVLSMDV